MVHQEAKSNIKNIVIFGKNGQVGSALLEILKASTNFNVIAYSSPEVDFNQLKELQQFLDNLLPIPDLIINAAAYTAVDNCESEKELADNINHKAVEIIANFCAKQNIKLIHYSTDYVFNGLGNQPFLEDDKDNLQPLNIYGKTKLAGEEAIINSKCNYIILRTSWVYDKNGKNFVNSMIKFLQERDSLNIVSDQIGSPTYAKDIALHTIEIINSNFINGIYHLTNEGYTSWYDFVIEISKLLKEKGIKLKAKEIKAISTKDYKTPATRPLNSRLSKEKIANIFGIKPRNWKEALRICLRSL